MSEERVAQILNQLAEEREYRAAIAASYDERISAIEADRDEACSEYDVVIVRLETEIKALVLELKQSVKGEFLHAIYSSPRVSWDTKALDGYMVAHPEIEAFRKVGSPSVSIRARR